MVSADPLDSDPTELERVCRACGGARLKHLYDAMEAGFELLCCDNCGAKRTWPEVCDDEIGRWYPREYYGDSNVRFNPVMERMTHWFAKARARNMAAERAPGRMLDVGCGRGMMLAGFRALGWDVHGIELSADSATHAREALALDVFTGPLDEAPYEEETFDLIVFWHSLEHFRRPDRAIARARALIKPDGRLVVAVPNADSLQASIFGRQWFHLDVPRHYHHFGPSSLETLLCRFGFKAERDVAHLNLEQNPYGIVQSAMNRAGFDENFLYSLLKTKSARAHTVWERPAAVLGTLALLPALAPTSLAFAIAEAALKRGGTIELIARPV